MDGLLTPVSITYKKQEQKEEDALVEASTPSPLSAPQTEAPVRPSHVRTAGDALEVLRNQPSFDDLKLSLAFLDEEKTFRITTPGPVAAQLVHVLVSEVIPNYWSILYGEMSAPKKGRASRKPQELELLLSFLRSITGLNAILLRLKQLIQQSKESKKKIGGPNILQNLRILLQLCSEVLKGNTTIEKIWKTIQEASAVPGKQKALWQELLNLVGSGKIVGIAAEAEAISNELSNEPNERYWIADSGSYSRWLGQNVSYWGRALGDESGQAWKCCSELLGKALRLGHPDDIAKELLNSMLLQLETDISQFLNIFSHLPSLEQRSLLYTFLKILSRDNLSLDITSEDDSKWWQVNMAVVSAAAKLLDVLIAGDEVRKNFLISWLTNSSGAGIGEGIAIRRAAIAALSNNKKDIEMVLEKSLSQFGDQLYIRHAPTLQQEVHAQVLLLSAGYVHRMAPLRLTMIMRTGSHLSVVSNRLSASSLRARFLGMVVGEALSSLVDKGDKVMDFKMEETKTSEAKWYKSLVNVKDTIGDLEALRSKFVPKSPKSKRHTTSKSTTKPNPLQGSTKILSIEEVEDDDEVSSDDGLTPYAKPDSDAEDSDEDPTLITRNKPTAPVYIRDLITYLRDTENYDRQKLGLMTASSLIRRKANFGTEVSSHAEEIATLLVGLQDKYEIEGFQSLRQQGMIAILVALPGKMGPWFSKTFFDGDYSISQRASILTTLGLGARELGGHGSEDKNLIENASTTFPSKMLPENMHKYYTNTNTKNAKTTKPSPSRPNPPPNAVDTLSETLQTTMLAPLATSAADTLTGPNILKVRTFSSRLAVEKARKKPIPNTLATMLSRSFFFPLTGRFFVHLKAYGSTSASNITFHPYLLSLFLKTLALMLHTSGPSTLSLPQMTSEFWDLCLSLRGQARGDSSVQEGLLFAFMTILEMNEGDLRAVAERHGRELVETREWVEGVFGGLAGGSEEDEKRRMLAAGVLVRIGECVEKYQRLMVGDLAGGF
ncbi:telomere length regulation protein [Rutstroemia sp. NJR-2017a WRK4]|nr:telomere length regulation protein [Rutstroemia sp. NJR-2017a WRK4]